jgi:hypothetical protein
MEPPGPCHSGLFVFFFFFFLFSFLVINLGLKLRGNLHGKSFFSSFQPQIKKKKKKKKNHSYSDNSKFKQIHVMIDYS